MADIEPQARQMLAAEYAQLGYSKRLAESPGACRMSEAAVRVISAALRAAPADDQLRCFRLNINGEWGSFYLREGVSGEGERQSHWCELTCNTSYGVVGYYWGSMGMPAARFLAKISRGYALGKLWGPESNVFDGAQAIVEARQLVLRERREGALSQEESRNRWNSLEDQEPSDEYEFRELVHDTPWLYKHLCEGGGPIGEVPNPQAVAFWEKLWPAFIDALSASAEPVTLANVKPPRNMRVRVPGVAEIKECTNE